MPYFMPSLQTFPKALFFIILSFSLFSTSYATDLTPDQDTLKKLSKTNAWWRLVHYKQHAYGVRSQVDQDDFFLHPQGYKNPLAELTATFKQLETSLNSATLL